MSRSFASYLTDDISLSAEEARTSFTRIYLVITFSPCVIMFISFMLSFLTKSSVFDNIIKWCMELYTFGIVERICISTIKYFNIENDKKMETEISKDKNLYQINKKPITIANARRIRYAGFLLFPSQGLIISIVIFEKLFILEQSVETCETYHRLFKGNPIYDNGCSIRPKFVPNISASEFFNPINAFRLNIPSQPNTNISHYCQNSTMIENKILSMEYNIQCIKYFFKWNNIIDTFTNVLQWHQITALIFRTIFYFTHKWQNTLGHTRYWSRISVTCRIIILFTLILIWMGIFIVYLLIIIAFFKTVLLTQLIVTYQTIAILLIPLLFVPLPLFNALTLCCWTICTILNKECEQESSDTLDTYRNILIYTKDD